MSIQKTGNKEVWIGLATVEPLEGNFDLGESKGATVNVTYLASSDSEFLEGVNQKMMEYGYNLVELEDVELFDFDRLIDYGDNLFEIASETKSTGSLQWGTFYTYDNE